MEELNQEKYRRTSERQDSTSSDRDVKEEHSQQAHDAAVKEEGDIKKEGEIKKESEARKEETEGVSGEGGPNGFMGMFFFWRSLCESCIGIVSSQLFIETKMSSLLNNLSCYWLLAPRISRPMRKI